jgi:hypothetical protein
MRLHGEIDLTINDFFAVEAKARSWYEKRKPEREIRAGKPRLETENNSA